MMEITFYSIAGIDSTPIRDYSVTAVLPDGSAGIDYWPPRKRKPVSVRVSPGSTGFYVIDDGDSVLYDSRDDVPCDMDEWRRYRDERIKRMARAFPDGVSDNVIV